jgi:hypothetical protein
METPTEVDIVQQDAIQDRRLGMLVSVVKSTKVY